MGSFEVAPGTQWDERPAWKHEMFPSGDGWAPFAERGVRKFPQLRDISCRSALTIHRGTTHRSPIARPVLVLGVDVPGAGHDKLHDLMVTQEYYDALPAIVRDHLVCRVVDQLIPVTQKHDIEGLVMGGDVDRAALAHLPPVVERLAAKSVSFQWREVSTSAAFPRGRRRQLRPLLLAYSGEKPQASFFASFRMFDWLEMLGGKSHFPQAALRARHNPTPILSSFRCPFA